MRIQRVPPRRVLRRPTVILQRYHRRGVEHRQRIPPCLGHRLVDGRLERARVDHQIRLSNRRDLARRELEVVRLRSRRRQAGDVGMIGRDALGDELERVEGDDDPQRTTLRCACAAQIFGLAARRRNEQ